MSTSVYLVGMPCGTEGTLALGPDLPLGQWEELQFTVCSTCHLVSVELTFLFLQWYNCHLMQGAATAQLTVACLSIAYPLVLTGHLHGFF